MTHTRVKSDRTTRGVLSSGDSKGGPEWAMSTQFFPNLPLQVRLVGICSR